MTTNYSLYKIQLIVNFFDNLRKNSDYFSNNYFSVKKFLVSYNELFLSTFFLEFEVFFNTSELKALDFSDFKKIFKKRTISQLLEFSPIKKAFLPRSKQIENLGRVWREMNRSFSNHPLNDLYNQIEINLMDKLLEFISVFEEKQEVDITSNELKMLVCYYNFYLELVYEMKCLRDTYFRNFFKQKRFPKAQLHTLFLIFSLDEGIFLILIELQGFMEIFSEIPKLILEKQLKSSINFKERLNNLINSFPEKKD